MSRLILSFISALIVCTLAACSTNREGTDESGSRTRGQLRRVEQNTGEVLDRANEAMESGVDSIDRSWSTPAERATRRNQELDKRERTDVDTAPSRSAPAQE